jgi:sugar lactone lactonase YvrE
LAKLKLAPKMKANVFASEEMFDNMINPVQMGVDTKGRLWAAVWPTYPKWEPLKQTNDALVILPDENRDGVADKMITFAKVQNPTGFEFWNGGVIVASAPDLIYLKDTDGDDVADIRERLLHGLDSADTHHAANNLVYGPGGYIYYQRGVFHVSNVETPWSGPRKDTASAMYRFNPRTFKFSHHANNSPNPHGISFDYWGYHYATDGTGGRAYQVRPNGKGGFKMQTLLKKTVRPVCSSGILSSDHFPEENNGNFLILNAIGFLGIKQYTMEYDDEGDVWGSETHDLLVSEDRNLRPTDFEIGDDGALYVSDWQNVIVGHMQHNVRDPNRNKTHGRIYRVTYEGRELSKHTNVDGQSIGDLLDLLKHPINGIRQRARVELSEHPSGKVIEATDKWIAQLDPKAKDDAHHFLEALWIYQRNDTKNEALLQQVLNSPVEHARISAKTVKQFWDNNL